MEKFSMEKAVNMLTPQQKRQSEIRERYKFQVENPIWEEDVFLKNDEIERRACTSEEKEQLDRSLKKLGSLFKDADFFWQLDGALNISLYKGEYIGIHKDVDISIELKDIDKIESFLGKKGFGLFLSSKEGEKNVYERVDGDAFRRRSFGRHPMIFAIDSDGKIRYDEEGFGLDTHIIKRNDKGEPVTSNDDPIPQEWIATRQINFNGETINCSHPALVAFYKLYCDRKYDDRDIQYLAESGALSKHDVEQIENTYKKHNQGIRQTVLNFVTRIISRINRGSDREEILDVLHEDEEIKERSRAGQDVKEMIDSFLNKLADKIVEMNWTDEELFEYVFSSTAAGKSRSKAEERIEILNSIVQ